MDGKYLHDTGVELIKLVKATLNTYRKFSNSAIEDDNISICGMEIITTLRYYPEQNTVSDIAEHLDFSKGLISREVEALRKNGYVTTAVDECDRRILRISINEEKAGAIIERQESKLFSLMYQMAGNLSDEEIKEFRRLTKIVMDNLSEADINVVNKDD